MRPTTIRLLPTLLLTAVLAVAISCGGSARDSTTTPGPSAAPTTAATATVAAAPPPIATPEPRPDGLTGAPVEVPPSPSAAFDAELLNVNAGSFPPLDYPSLATVEEATWLADEALVLGAVQNGQARAYPLSMMRFHHVANDELGGKPYLVTF
jgi:hypothetical protein